jgi:DNA-binding NtrC family response regulator
MEAELFVPLTIGGRALGAVLLGKRILGESYGASEYELIGGIADLAARTLRGRQADPKALRANAVTETRASRRLAALRSRHPALARFAGQGQATLDLFEEIVALADLDLPVLIQGETGTGKELVARALHELSRRSAEPFEAVNCAAIPRELVANVLFGHERGAFTGALSRARGAFEQAGQGTIFLDEIGDMSLDAQASLLRVLQERSFRRVGGEGELPAPARVVSASNIDLAEAVRAGTFRSDLFYRIQMFMIRVRPLRERPEDVPGIVERILAARLDAQNASLTPSREFLAALSARELPGNYRELESLVLGAARRARGEHVLRAQHLLESPAPSRNESLRSSQDGSARSTSKKRIDPDLPTYADMERRYICEIVRLAKGNRNRAAKLMGIPRTTLASRMKKLGITESE